MCINLCVSIGLISVSRFNLSSLVCLCFPSSRVFHAAGEFPFATAHGQFPHSGVRTVRAARRPVVGVVLAEPGGNGRSRFAGHHHGADDDLPGAGGANGSAEGALPDGTRFLCVPIVCVYFRDDYSSEYIV